MCPVNQTMGGNLFPLNFPPELARDAFISGGEAAWPPKAASMAVEWFAAHGYAVLGTELWLLQNGAIQSLPVGLSGMKEVHGNTVDRGVEEAWSVFVSRATAETIAYLQSFHLAEIVEEGGVCFNVVWVNEADFEKLTQWSTSGCNAKTPKLRSYLESQ